MIALGSTESDDEWLYVIKEASLFSMPRSLGCLFVTISLSRQPSNCLRLFNNFVEAMSEDFPRNHPKNVARKMCIFDISEQLIALNKDNAALGLPQPLGMVVLPSVKDFNSGLASNVVLNDRKQSVYDAVIDALHNASLHDRRLFVDGSRGSGKIIEYKKI